MDFQQTFQRLVRDGLLLSEARAIALKECGIVPPAPDTVRLAQLEEDRERERQYRIKRYEAKRRLL